MEARINPKKNESVRVSCSIRRYSMADERDRMAVPMPIARGMRNLKGISLIASEILPLRISRGI